MFSGVIHGINWLSVAQVLVQWTGDKVHFVFDLVGVAVYAESKRAGVFGLECLPVSIARS